MRHLLVLVMVPSPDPCWLKVWVCALAPTTVTKAWEVAWDPVITGMDADVVGAT